MAGKETNNKQKIKCMKGEIYGLQNLKWNKFADP